MKKNINLLDVKTKSLPIIALGLFSLGLFAMGGERAEATETLEPVAIETKRSQEKMVNLNELFEIIGGTVKVEDEKDKKVSAQYEDTLIEFALDSEFVLVNGEYETFVTKTVNDSIMLPQNSKGAISEKEDIFVPAEFIERVFDFKAKEDNLMVPKVEKEVEENVEIEEQVEDVATETEEIIEEQAENKMESKPEESQSSESASSNNANTSNTSNSSNSQVSSNQGSNNQNNTPNNQASESKPVETPTPTPTPEPPVVAPEPTQPVKPAVTLSQVASAVAGSGYNIEVSEYGNEISVSYDVSVGSANQNIPDSIQHAYDHAKKGLSNAGIKYEVYNGGSFFVLTVYK